MVVPVTATNATFKTPTIRRLALYRGDYRDDVGLGATNATRRTIDVIDGPG